jgi:hypothetical protein
MNEQPIARHFVACADIQSNPERRVTLVDLIHIIRVRKEEEFPCLVPTICFYALLTNGRGEHTFAISVVLTAEAEDLETFRSHSVRRDLGQDPLVLHGFPMRLNSLRLGRPGQYEFRLLCDELIIATESIEVRSTS